MRAYTENETIESAIRSNAERLGEDILKIVWEGGDPCVTYACRGRSEAQVLEMHKEVMSSALEDVFHTFIRTAH